jgi:hypothetical protein
MPVISSSSTAAGVAGPGGVNAQTLHATQNTSVVAPAVVDRPTPTEHSMAQQTIPKSGIATAFNPLDRPNVHRHRCPDGSEPPDPTKGQYL